MSRVLILARDHGEARSIAVLAGLGASEWDTAGPGMSVGRRGNVVLATSMDCWRRYRDTVVTAAIRDILHTGDFKVVPVPCPMEWEQSRFQLPEGWREPKSYPPKVALLPGKRLPWVQRLRQVFRGR